MKEYYYNLPLSTANIMIAGGLFNKFVNGNSNIREQESMSSNIVKRYLKDNTDLSDKEINDRVDILAETTKDKLVEAIYHKEDAKQQERYEKRLNEMEQRMAKDRGEKEAREYFTILDTMVGSLGLKFGKSRWDIINNYFDIRTYDDYNEYENYKDTEKEIIDFYQNNPEIKNNINEVLRAKANGDKLTKEIGAITDWEIDFLNSKGFEVDTQTKHTISTEFIAHRNNRHGETTEKQQDQLPVSNDDIRKIPIIIENPDILTVDIEKKGAKYQKQFDDGNVYFVEVFKKDDNQLEAKTIYKKKISKNGATMHRQVQGDNNSIIQPNKKSSNILNQTTPMPSTVEIDGQQKTIYNNNNEPIADSEEKIKNFYRWFGESKVVDENKRPIITYHGTINGGFATFKKSDNGIWFSDNEDIAGGYGFATDEETGEYIRIIGDDSKRDNTQKGFWEQGIYETYLKIENPLIIDFKNKKATDRAETEQYVKIAKENGNDGVILKNIIDNAYGEQEYVANDYIVFNPNQIKEIKNKGTFDINDEIIYNQFIYSKQAQLNRDLKRKLNQAKQMAEEKQDNETIRKQTGWFRDISGEWRYEINDKLSKVKNIKEIKKELKDNKQNVLMLPEILEHPKLFEIYPTLNNVPVYFNNKAKNSMGTFSDFIFSSINLNLNNIKTETELKKTLMHEIQHYIQYLENRPISNYDNDKDQNKYWKSQHEVEARNTAKRTDYSPQERKQFSPEYTQDVKTKDIIITQPQENSITIGEKTLFQTLLNQSAYHGSPYKFDSFTTDKIGTGEGVQAHGWGLYFALDKNTAKNYRDRLNESKKHNVSYNDEISRRVEKAKKNYDKLYDNIANNSLQTAQVYFDNMKDLFNFLIYEEKKYNQEELKQFKINQFKEELKRFFDKKIEVAKTKQDIGEEIKLNNIQKSFIKLDDKKNIEEVFKVFKAVIDNYTAGHGDKKLLEETYNKTQRVLLLRSFTTQKQQEFQKEYNILLDDFRNYGTPQNEKEEQIEKAIKKAWKGNILTMPQMHMFYYLAEEGGLLTEDFLTGSQDILDYVKANEKKYFNNKRLGKADKQIITAVEQVLETVPEIRELFNSFRFTEQDKNDFEKQLQEKLQSQQATLFEVDIPEDNEMLWEEKTLKEQPKEVKEKLERLYHDYFSLDLYNEFSDDPKGEEIYKSIARAIADDEGYSWFGLYENKKGEYYKKASKLLNEYGIKGIRYNGRTDGECAVVFDDKSIRILEFLQTQPQQWINNNIIDLTDQFKHKPTFREVKEYIETLVETAKQFATLNPDWLIDIKKEPSNTKQRRINSKILNYNNFKNLSTEQQQRHNNYILQLEDILKKAEYTGEQLNNKADKKPQVEKYHYFISNVKVGDKIYQIVFDTEQYKGESEEKPQTVHLYNISEINEMSLSPEQYPTGSFNKIGTHRDNSIVNQNSQMSRENIKGQFTTDVKYSYAVINLFRNKSDQSTLLHETMHFFEKTIEKYAKQDYPVAQQMYKEIKEAIWFYNF